MEGYIRVIVNNTERGTARAALWRQDKERPSGAAVGKIELERLIEKGKMKRNHYGVRIGRN